MERRSFFERYRPTNLTADPLPLKVLNHSIWKAEMLGHALDWASQYLHQKNCPSYLISPLLGKVLKEMSKADLSECFAKTVGGRSMDEVDADIVENIKYQPLRLMQSVTSKVDDICLRYKEENDQIETDFPNQSPEDGLAPQVYGASYHTIKNTRRTLEDRMVILPEIEKIFNFKTRASYFAVFDGHNGVEAAAYSAAHLHQHLVSSPDFPSDLPAAINYAFEVTDTALLMKCKDEHIRSGTTVVIALIVPGNIYVAWAGDSQAVLVQNSQPVSLVSPHKPDREDEMRRIKGVGGEVISVSGTWRVNGNLAVSRAIGNLDYKEYVTSTPEISHIEVNGSEEFLILACDGLWDVVSPQRSVDILRNSILSDDPSDIDSVSQKLVIEAKQSGSGDNITVIVVLLKPKEELRKLYKAIKMNGSAEAPVEVVPVPVEAPPAPVEVVPVPVEVLPVGVATPPASPSKVLSKNPAPSSKTSLPSSPVKSSSATKPGSATTTRNNLGMRSPSAQKAPVKIGERRATSATTKAPLPPVKTTSSATKTTVQKDGVGVTAKPSTQRPATATTRAPVAPRTATATTTKKPLKPEETDKPATTRTVVPPRPRPGTAPLSSRLTTSKAPVKQDAAKTGEESGAVKESATKRSVLNSARPTASKEGGVTSRVTQPRPATSTAPKPRVPSATARPASASVATSKPGSTAAPKPGVTRAAAPTKPPVASTTASRPPLKKPVGPSVTTATKKDAKSNGQTSLAPKSSDKKIIKREGGAAAGITSKVNGIGKVVDVSKVINGVQAEVEEKIVVSDKVKDVDALISEEKGQLEDGVEKVSNGIEKQDDVDIAKEAYQVDNVDVTNENDLSEKEKEDHGKVINGDIAYEDFMVTKPYAVDTAENVTLDQVKHDDDNIKSELNESKQVEKSVAQLSESETVSTLELQSETENVPVDSPVAESAACEVHAEVHDNLIEQASSVLPVVDDISSEIEGLVPEVKASVDEENISTNAEECSDPPEEQVTDKDSGLDEDLISDRAQDNECLKEIEENVSSVEASEKLQSVVPDPDHEIMEDNYQFITDDAQPDPESLVIHDTQEEVNTPSQEDQHPSEVHSFDPLVEAPVISAFPDTDVDVHTQSQEDPDTPDDVEAVIELSSNNPFADSGPEAEGKENVSGSEAFEDSKGEDEQEKDSVPHAVHSEEQDKLAEASAQYEHEIAVFPDSKESEEIEPFASDNKSQCVDLEFNIDDREQPSVEDRELVRSEIHTENFTFDSGADGTTENENMQVLDTSGIRNDDFMEDEKQNAIDPTSELQLEPERIEENLVSNEVCSLEQDLIHSGLEERSEETVKEESTTAEVTEDLFLANTDTVTDALPLEPGSLDLGHKNTELDVDPFASQFESHSAPLLDTDVSAVVPDFGDPFTISQNPDEPQLQQGLDQFLIGGDLLGADQKFGNFEFSQGGVNDPENLDFVLEENTNEKQPRHDQDFDCLGFSKIEQQPHETTVLLQNNPFLIDTPIMSKANTNLEQINKNEIDVGFGFGNDNGIGSQLLSSSGGCVDTLLDINSSTCPGSDSEIMYHQTPSDGGNHTGNLVDSVGNEDNDALAILNR